MIHFYDERNLDSIYLGGNRMNIWLECLRRKIRFDYNGKQQINAEDLFELNAKELQSIYRLYSKEYRDCTEDVLDTSIESVEAENALIKRDIVRAVYTVILAEQMAKQDAIEKEETRQEILAVMAEKQKDELKELSIEELQERLDSL